MSFVRDDFLSEKLNFSPWKSRSKFEHEESFATLPLSSKEKAFLIFCQWIGTDELIERNFGSSMEEKNNSSSMLKVFLFSSTCLMNSFFFFLVYHFILDLHGKQMGRLTKIKKRKSEKIFLDEINVSNRWKRRFSTTRLSRFDLIKDNEQRKKNLIHLDWTIDRSTSKNGIGK